jgi:hypothetical protein
MDARSVTVTYQTLSLISNLGHITLDQTVKELKKALRAQMAYLTEIASPSLGDQQALKARFSQVVGIKYDKWGDHAQS